MMAAQDQAARTADAATEPPCYHARELTDDRGLAHIQLDGKLYTLRITRQGKLILTR